MVPVGTDWLHEIKHDGYRLLVRKDGDAVSQVPQTPILKLSSRACESRSKTSSWPKAAISDLKFVRQGAAQCG